MDFDSNQETTSSNAVIDEITTWLEENWDPDLTVAQWWEKLGLSGWAAPGLPTNAYGKGLSRNDAVAAMRAIGRFGALGPPNGLGLMLAAPTIATHGTQQQIDLYVRDIVTGQKAWCQLFSEPGAGSDLAGLGAKAQQDGDIWIINGQKVWTSGGQSADLGMLLARTNPEAPKHQGISYFALDMHQPEVEVRPLREMTGRALFSEVFMSDANVTNSAMIGDLNNGWAVANTTLAFERAGLGSGGAGGAGVAVPGTIAGNLDKRAGDFVSGKVKGSADSGVQAFASGNLMIDIARKRGKLNNKRVRQGLMKLHTLNEIGRYSALRQKAMKQLGRDVPGLPNIAKLSMSEVMRTSRDVGLEILGPSGMLHAYSSAAQKDLIAAGHDPLYAVVTETALFAQAPAIYGGTDQIQKNIIGERVLGLPKEPNNDKTTPFSQLPKNG